MEQRKKYIVKKADGGQISPEEMAMMEQQQAQQQGAPQQGAPQQGGGQDEAMQQIMQMVEQMIQQGAQPADVAAELLGQQVPPEAIMQVFVQMGLPEQEAQAAIEQAMQAGPPAQEGAPQGPPQGQPSPEEMAAMQQQQGTPPMMEAGGDFASLRQAEYGMMGDPPMAINDKQYIQNNYPGATIGASGNALDVNGNVVGKGIRPEFHTTGKYFMGADQSGFSSDTGVPTALRSDGTWGPIGAIPNSQYGGEADNIEEPMLEMQKYGGQFKKLMKKAWGGDLNIPGTTSDNYVSERASMFVNKVKQNTGLASLNQDMTGDPLMKSLGGESLPIAELGAYEKWAKAQEQKKAVAEYNAYRNDGKVEGDEGYASYGADDADYGEFLQSYNKRNNIGVQAQNNSSNGFVNNARIGANNTVGYGNPFGGGWRAEAYRGTSPFARLLANSGRSYNAPIIRGNNLPGGMSGANFLGQMGAQGMTGKTADGTPYQISAGEKFKEGSFFNPFQKRRKGIRYNIDYGAGLNADGTVNPEGATSSPAADFSSPEALDRRGMKQDMSRKEKQAFRKLQRGRDGVSENDAYQRILDTRGGTEDPAQTGVNDPNAVFNPTDPDDMDLDNNAGLNESPRARDMSGVPADIRAEMDAQAIQNEQRAAAAAAGDAMGVDNQIVNPAAEVDPALADAGAQEAQGFQPMTEADLTPQQLRQIKNGKLSLDGINQDAQREFDVNADMAAAQAAEGTGYDADGNVVPAGEDFANTQAPLATMDGAPMSPANSFVAGQDGSPFPERTAPNFSAAEDYTGPAQMTEQLQQKMMLDNYGKGMRTGAPADPGITRMPLKPAFGKPGEPTIVGNVPRATEDVQNKMMLDNYGKGMKGPGYFDSSGTSSTSTGVGADPNFASQIEGTDEPVALPPAPIRPVGPVGPVAGPENEPSVVEPWLQPKVPTRPAPVQRPNEIDQMISDDVNAAGGMTYGGGVDNEALMNAVNLINRAFGGNAYAIPQAVGGMDLQGRLSMEEAMAKQGMNPGQIDVLEDSQFNIDQGALGQTFRKGVGIANFGFDYADDYVNTQKARGIRQDPLQNIASYQGMGSGIHNQQGQDYANNVNAQSLNVTGNYSVELGGMPRQMMEYGGQMYEIGGSVNITDEEKRRFEAAGFTLT